MSWLLRKRTPSETISGGQTRIRLGAMGDGSPLYSMVDVDPNSGTGIYDYHEGALFSPGAMNFVFEPNFELPMVGIWGKGFLRVPNVFNPLQPVQLYSNPNIVTNGLGGLEAGQMALQPLLLDNPLGNEQGGA